MFCTSMWSYMTSFPIINKLNTESLETVFKAPDFIHHPTHHDGLTLSTLVKLKHASDKTLSSPIPHTTASNRSKTSGIKLCTETWSILKTKTKAALTLPLLGHFAKLPEEFTDTHCHKTRTIGCQFPIIKAMAKPLLNLGSTECHCMILYF